LRLFYSNLLDSVYTSNSLNTYWHIFNYILEANILQITNFYFRKGHISILHLWWARRPLIAARAAVFAALIAAPETYQKRTCLKKTMVDLCR